MSGSEFTNGGISVQIEVYRMCEANAAVAELAYRAAVSAPRSDDSALHRAVRAAARSRKWQRRGHRALMNDTRFINAVIRWI